MLQATLVAFGGIPSDQLTAITKALSASNVRLCEGPAPSGFATLVVFASFSAQLCRFIREISQQGSVRLLALSTEGLPRSDAVWALLHSGASDVLAWNAAEAISGIECRLVRWAAVDALVQSELVCNHLIGRSTAWLSAIRNIVEMAVFSNAPSLVCGETGTGKELVVRLIHTLDTRQTKRDLVLVDCTTIAPDLAGSELFGHERGAYTGAVSSRQGAFLLADGGTLFLDEIGELPTPLQSELLRAIQEGTFKPVGSNSWQQAKFRLVTATNRDLLREVSEGRFRRDLYYRIAAVTCTLPPLRDRRDDIIPLVHHFVSAARPELRKNDPLLDGALQEYLVTREYPGNVRDLKQLVARMLVRHAGNGVITVGDLPEDERPAPNAGEHDRTPPSTDFSTVVRAALDAGLSLRDIGRAAEDAAIRLALVQAGTLRGAAKQLRVTDRALQLRRRADAQSAGPASATHGSRES